MARSERGQGTESQFNVKSIFGMILTCSLQDTVDPDLILVESDPLSKQYVRFILV